MTNAEKIYEENRNLCKSIAENIDMYVNGGGYKCPECGSVHPFDEYETSEHENEGGCTCYNCPNCGAEIEKSELEAVTIYDYFCDIFYYTEGLLVTIFITILITNIFLTVFLTIFIIW